MGFRLTCYYYRKAYYRSFWLSPPACGIADAGSVNPPATAPTPASTRFPLVLQNLHRYFFYFGLFFNVILTIDAIAAFRQPGTGSVSAVGTLVLCVNAVLLWLYSLGCHACRHLCGGRRQAVLQGADPPLVLAELSGRLNAHHKLFAWLVALLVGLHRPLRRLVASGTIHDYGFHF